MHVSMMHVSMMYVPMIHVSMVHVSMMHVYMMHVPMIHVSMVHVSMMDNDAYVHDAYICDIQSLTMLHVCMMLLKCCDGHGDSRSRMMLTIIVETPFCERISTEWVKNSTILFTKLTFCSPDQRNEDITWFLFNGSNIDP